MNERLPELTNPEVEKQNEWEHLIEFALTAPGSLGRTYNRFYNYSFMNQILLYMQGVEEPVATYKRWQELGRQVKKGSKAKTIMRPLFVKETKDGEEVQKLRGFKYVNCIFTLSETEGEPLPRVEIPDWQPDVAMRNLHIEEVPFKVIDGNTAGYSYEKKLAINPVATFPIKTLMHELGHIVLGHTEPHRQQEYVQHRGLAEFQAEATAYLVMKELEAMNHMSDSESRAYIQTWLRGERPEPKAIRQVFAAVETILKAGRSQSETNPSNS